MASYIEFKEPISVSTDIKVDGISLGSNAFTSTTIPTNNNQLTNGRGYITSASLPTVNNSTITLSASSGISGGGNFTLNQSSNKTISLTNSDKGSSQNIFKSVTNGVGTISALSNNDTLTLTSCKGFLC